MVSTVVDFKCVDCINIGGLPTINGNITFSNGIFSHRTRWFEMLLRHGVPAIKKDTPEVNEFEAHHFLGVMIYSLHSMNYI